MSAGCWRWPSPAAAATPSSSGRSSRSSPPGAARSSRSPRTAAAPLAPRCGRWSTCRSCWPARSSASPCASLGLGAVAEPAAGRPARGTVRGSRRSRRACCTRSPSCSRSASWSTCTSCSARWCRRTWPSRGPSAQRCVLAPALVAVARVAKPLVVVLGRGHSAPAAAAARRAEGGAGVGLHRRGGALDRHRVAPGGAARRGGARPADRCAGAVGAARVRRHGARRAARDGAGGGDARQRWSAWWPGPGSAACRSSPRISRLGGSARAARAAPSFRVTWSSWVICTSRTSSSPTTPRIPRRCRPRRVRALVTVPADQDVEDALVAMQRAGTHLARVVDAAGTPVGVVFLEDVLEELVGEVRDATQRPSRTRPGRARRHALDGALTPAERPL